MGKPIIAAIANLNFSEAGISVEWGGYFGFSAEEGGGGYFWKIARQKSAKKSEVRLLALLRPN